MTRAEAIANWQAKFHPDAIVRLEKELAAHRHYQARGLMSAAIVESMEALLELAKACAATEDET